MHCISKEENSAVEEIKEELPEEKSEEEVINPTEEEKNINDLIIYYLIGALVICLTAIVTLILVNKKNKNKISKK